MAFTSLFFRWFNASGARGAWLFGSAHALDDYFRDPTNAKDAGDELQK
jgi:hypothetical protein